MTKAKLKTGHEPIAVVGMACRYPGAKNISEFWRLLVDKKSTITEMTEDRSNPLSRILHAIDPVVGKLWWGKLDDIENFDAGFFKVSPREASLMDPQQRLSLKVACEALEDAALPQRRLIPEKTGVIVATINNEYQDLLLQQTNEVDALVATGGSRSALAGRISHALNLKGPSLTLDSDRSSALVAIHLACQSIRTGESTTVLVGGANLILNPILSQAFARSKMLAPDGKCKFGDRQANGFVRAEGVAFLVLKSKRQAIEDRDRIYAEIHGSSVLHQGRSNHDIKVPVETSQQMVILSSCKEAGLTPGDVQYIEAHGTGTPIGDSTELRAIGALMKAQTRSAPCLVGSVKTNVGHTEAVAGIAGLIKTALCLHHQQIPASLNFSQSPAGLPLHELNIEIPTDTRPWPRGEKRRIAGVSSFGLTGTISHVTLSEADAGPQPTRKKKRLARSPQVLTISGESNFSLDQNVKNMIHFLSELKDSSALPSICHFANVRRNHYSHRVAVIGASAEEMAEALTLHSEGESTPTVTKELSRLTQKRVAFVFGENDIDPATMLNDLDRLFPSLEIKKMSSPKGGEHLNVKLIELWRALGMQPSALIGFGRGADIAAQVARQASGDRRPMPLCLQTQSGTDDAAGQLTQFIADLGIDILIDPLFGLGHAANLENVLKRNFPNSILLSSHTEKDELEPAILKSLSLLHCHGLSVEWNRLLPTAHDFVSLPLYAWEDKPYWHTNYNSEVKNNFEKSKENYQALISGSSLPERKEMLRDILLYNTQTMLGPRLLKPLDTEEHLTSQGFDQEMFDELKRRLEKTLSLNLPITLFKRYPSVILLVNYLASLLDSETKGLGQILMENRAVDKEDLLSSAEEQKNRSEEEKKHPGEKIGSVLLRKGLITPEELRHALTAQAIEPMAIVGMAFHLSTGQHQPKDLWTLLQNENVVDVNASANFQFDSQVCPNPMPHLSDAQNRLLGVTWNAIEHAGQNPLKLLASRTGVYFAVSIEGEATAYSGCADTVAAAYGLCGPALDLVGGESSSLSAFHLACQSLRSGEIDMALVGGCHIPTGQSGSKGIYAVLVLKRLSNALVNRDQILAQASGSATTHSGLWQNEGGLNDTVQATAVREALNASGLSEKQISYVEMGDARHLDTIQTVFQHQPVIGVTKDLFSDCGATLGTFAVIKTILAFQHGLIPPGQSWPTDRKERIAAVHTAGSNGNTTHLLLKEPSPKLAMPVLDTGPHILCLSAQDEANLKALQTDYLEFLQDREDSAMGDICYTAAIGRPEWPHRIAVTAVHVNEMRHKLKAAVLAAKRRDTPSVAFLLADDHQILNTHWSRLYRQESELKNLIDLCTRTYAYLGGNEKELHNEIMHSQTTLSEAALYVRHLATIQVLNLWGIQAKVLIATSRGELAAAHACGAMSLEDGFKLILKDEISDLNISLPQIPLYSLSQRGLLSSQVLSKDYWQQRTQNHDKTQLKPASLSTFAVDLALSFGSSAGLISSAPENVIGADGFYNALVELYRAGVKINWPQYYRHLNTQRTAIPVTRSRSARSQVIDIQSASNEEIRNMIISIRKKAA